MAGRGTFDYFMLLLIPIPALMAAMSSSETRRWTTAGDLSPAIAAGIDWRMNFLAMFSYIIMIAMRETIH
jgi:hypothetical protein